MTRVAFVIPHYFSGVDPASVHGSVRPGTRAIRVTIFDRVLFQIHSLFTPRHHGLDVSESRPDGMILRDGGNPFALDFEILVFTTGASHLLGDIRADKRRYRHMPTEADAPFLGFECARWIRDHAGEYDFFCHMEDDILIRDPLFFRKAALFNSTFDAVSRGLLLHPHTFEENFLAGDPNKPRPIERVYIDYKSHAKADIDGPRLTLDFAGIPFELEPALNPSSGCYVVNSAQAAAMGRHSDFLDRTKIMITPMDTAAWGFVARTFKLYKPALNSLSFFEIQHGHQSVLRSYFESGVLKG